MPNHTKPISAAVFCFMTTLAAAGEVDVEAVSYKQAADGSYRFDVTLRHADAGWDHYADRWDVLTPAGEIIATRTLHHPHGHDSVHGYGGEEKRVDLSAAAK
jgi:hypothetical protein